MSSTELFALLDRAQNGDDAACQQVLLENTGLIWSIVKRYYGCGVEVDDLYQLGCIGFIKAVKGFDLTYGTQFSTYAVPKIAGEIRRFLRDDGAIKVGRSVREKGQMLWSARERLRQQLGRDPHLSEVAQETGLGIEEIASIDLANGTPESLQQETAEGLTLESTLGTAGPEEHLVEKIALREAIDALPEREKMTILLRFFKGLTQQQTAHILEVSQVQVSRLERKGLHRLRELLQE
jgi:RNA polymerase sporulation-specific sigma factor